MMLIDYNICDEDYFPVEHVKAVLQDIGAIDYFHIPDADKEESRLCQKFAYQMQQRRVNCDHVERIFDGVQQQERYKQLKHMLSSFTMNYRINCSIHSINKATLVHDTINIMLDVWYFQNSPIIKCLSADYLSSSSSAQSTNMDPSLVNHGKRLDFSVVSNREKHLLLALEVKRCGRSVSGNSVKLA